MHFLKYEDITMYMGRWDSACILSQWYFRGNILYRKIDEKDNT